MAVTQVRAREVLDCRGLPTVRVEVTLADGATGGADVPSGRSTGSHEAAELRDGGARYRGFGVRQAVGNVTGALAKAITGMPADRQREIDGALVCADGTPAKSAL